MAEKTRKKNIVVPIIAGIVVLAGVIVAIMLLNRPATLDDNFFVSDDQKYVLNMEDKSYGAIKSHTVVYYKEEQITKVEKYFEFEDDETANIVFNELKSDEENNTFDFSLNKKYIVFTNKVEEYKGISASDIKATFDDYDKTFNGVDETNSDEDHIDDNHSDEE